MALSARAAEILRVIGGLAPAEADAYLDSSCSDLPEVRREVEEHRHTMRLSATVAGGEPPPAAAAGGAPLAPGTQVGAYRIEGIQGQGGFGVVYRARQASGDLVALKTVRVPRLGLLHAIRREIQALSRLRHEGIVPVVGHGVVDGLPWYAMPLLRGEPFATGARRSAAGGRPRLERAELVAALTRIRRLCTPLGYLHGEGLVHRDLKPDNVIVVDGFPVVLDFGLSSVASAGTSRDRLENAGATVGTIVYMSPEQGRGEIVDARSDLYAVGCMLYELLAGRPPFLGGAGDVLQAHQSSEPEPPSAHVEGIPLELDFLVLRLLAKEPRHRVGYAADLARQLEELGASPGGRGERGRSYLYRAPLVGRGEELGRGSAMLRGLRQGRGGLVLIRGESGIGKTRLATELGRRATQAGLTVLTAACEAGAPAPLNAFTALLEAAGDRCRERGPREAERLLGSRGATLALFVPSLRTIPGVTLEPSQTPPHVARQRLLADVRETLLEMARGNPLVLLVDDLQWADELSLGALALLAAPLRQAGALVVGTVRSDATPAALDDLAGNEHVVVVELGRLGPGGIARMAGDMLAIDAPPEELAAALARHAAGNPLFVAEYLRAATERGILQRDELGVWRAGADLGPEGLPLPRSVEELLAQRLESMTAPARSLAGVAAALGDETSPELLARTASLADEEQLDALQELVRRSVLEEEGDQLRFTHGRLRQVAYEAMAPERRRAVHVAAAEAIEALHASALAAHAAELARHWQRGGHPAKARGYHLEAASAAAAKSAHEEELRHLRAYLELADVLDRERVVTRCHMAQGPLSKLGRLAEACDELARAREEARQIGEEGPERAAIVSQGCFLGQMRRSTEARPLLEEAVARCEAAGDHLGAARALGYLGALGFQEGASDAAIAACEESAIRFRRYGDASAESSSLSNLAMLYRLRGRRAEGMAAIERAVALARDFGSRHLQSSTLNHLAVFLLEAQRLDEAATANEECLAIARRIHVPHMQVMALQNLSIVRRRQARIEDARRSLEEARAIVRSDPALAEQDASIAVDLAGIDADSGDLDGAAAILQAVVAALRAPAHAQRAEALDALGCLELVRTGPGAVAAGLLDEAFAEAQAAQHAHWIGAIHCHRGRLALARGEDAHPHLALARDVLTGAGMGGELEEEISELEADLAWQATGAPLVCGRRPSAVPGPQLAWIRAHRSDALPHEPS